MGPHASLEALIIDPTALPEGCTVRPLDDNAPPFMTSNPMASDGATFIEGISMMAFRGDGSPAAIEEALMGVYDSTHELGIIAFRFSDPVTAQEAHEAATSNADGQEILRRGNTVAIIWRDGRDDACFQALSSHAKGALEIN